MGGFVGFVVLSVSVQTAFQRILVAFCVDVVISCNHENTIHTGFCGKYLFVYIEKTNICVYIYIFLQANAIYI